MSKDKKNSKRKINLALQGGGTHGAYTWGVLDRLLEDDRLIIEGVSGTSAGGMNAAIMVDGYIKNGRQGAKDALYTFWQNISNMAQHNPLHNPNLLGMPKSCWNLDSSPAYIFFDIITRIFSPYQINPFNINPLKDLIEDLIDFETLQSSNLINLFVTATSVSTGQPHIFHHKQITSDTLMASSCLPSMFQAIEINNDHYWDGGYAGNPSIWPLTYNSQTTDIVIVEINPVIRKEIPLKGSDIINRINEISFNASLIAEIKSIDFINNLIDENHLVTKKYRKLHIHLIESAEEMLELNASSKLNTSWDFLSYLHQLGRKSAQKWLDKNFDCLGNSSSADIHNTYLNHAKHPFKVQQTNIK